MKNFLCATVLSCLSLAAASQNPPVEYNKQLADSLGSDQYGMKAYVLVILKTGPAVIPAKGVVDSLFKGHMDNIGKLAAAGKLVVAGPFKKNDKSYRGIFILNVATVDEAKILVDADPAVKAGLLEAEMLSWYGSAALPMYLPIHSTIQKSSM